MKHRPCLEPGCGRITSRTRCHEHERAKDRARGTRQERGYDVEHDTVGRVYQQRLDAGERFTCWRCDHPIEGTRRGVDWQLGHDDVDRSIHRGPEHPSCNLATSGRDHTSPTTPG